MKETNIQEILKIAKKRFKPGTQYRGFLSNILQNKIETIQLYDNVILFDNCKNIGINSHDSYIYYRGKWAHIINTSNIHELW